MTVASKAVYAALLPMVCYLGCFTVFQWWRNFPVTRSMANTPRTSNTSRKNPPIRVKDNPAMMEQVVLITLSPGMNCVAQNTQYAINSGGQNVASSETKAASMKALPKRNQRLRSLYLRLLRHRLTAKRLAKSAPQYTFQLVTVYSSGTPLRNSCHMARASARWPIRMRQASTKTFRPTPSRKRKTKYFSFSMAAGPYAGTSDFAAGLNQPLTARSAFRYRPATLAWESSTVLLMEIGRAW